MSKIYVALDIDGMPSAAFDNKAEAVKKHIENYYCESPAEVKVSGSLDGVKQLYYLFVENGGVDSSHYYALYKTREQLVQDMIKKSVYKRIHQSWKGRDTSDNDAEQFALEELSVALFSDAKLKKIHQITASIEIALIPLKKKKGNIILADLKIKNEEAREEGACGFYSSRSEKQFSLGSLKRLVVSNLSDGNLTIDTDKIKVPCRIVNKDFSLIIKKATSQVRD